MRTYFFLVGIVLIAGGAWLAWRRAAVAWRGLAAVGQVVAFEERRSDGDLHYLPVVSFRDQRGHPHRFTSPAGGADRRPPLGSVVNVRYLPEAPERAFIVSFLHMWAAPAGLLALGLGALLGGMKG